VISKKLNTTIVKDYWQEMELNDKGRKPA